VNLAVPYAYLIHSKEGETKVKVMLKFQFTNTSIFKRCKLLGAISTFAYACQWSKLPNIWPISKDYIEVDFIWRFFTVIIFAVKVGSNYAFLLEHFQLELQGCKILRWLGKMRMEP